MIAELFFSVITAIVAIIWKPGLIYRNNHPPFLLNCHLYFLQTYPTHSSKLRLLLVLKGTMAFFFLELHKGAQHCLNTAYLKFLTSHYCLELILSHESWSYWCSTAWQRFGLFKTHFLANSSTAAFSNVRSIFAFGWILNTVLDLLHLSVQHMPRPLPPPLPLPPTTTTFHT